LFGFFVSPIVTIFRTHRSLLNFTILTTVGDVHKWRSLFCIILNSQITYSKRIPWSRVLVRNKQLLGYFKNCPHFKEPEGSFPFSEPPTSSCSETGESSPHGYILEDPFSYCTPIYVYVSQLVFSFQVIRLKCYTQLLPLHCVLHTPPITSSYIFITLAVSGKEYKFKCSHYYVFFSFALFILGPNITFSTF
jgi:hypothetical protein